MKEFNENLYKAKDSYFSKLLENNLYYESIIYALFSSMIYFSYQKINSITTFFILFCNDPHIFSFYFLKLISPYIFLIFFQYATFFLIYIIYRDRKIDFYFVLLVSLFLYKCIHYTSDFNFILSLLFSLENIRLTMKIYSYIQEKSSKSTFKSFVYFLVAPTLIYQDEYEKTKNVRLKFVILRLLEVVDIIFIMTISFDLFGNSESYFIFIPSTIFLLGGFYITFQSWNNFTGEILRFRDREFYSKWWESKTYGEYYRTWNIIVYKWIHKYVYLEFLKKTKSKFICSLISITLSAIVHEYIIICSLKIVYPVMYVFFGICGIILIYVSKYYMTKHGVFCTIIIGNYFMWQLYFNKLK